MVKEYRLNEKYHKKLIDKTKENGMYGKTDLQLMAEGRYNDYVVLFMYYWESQRVEEINKAKEIA